MATPHIGPATDLYPLGCLLFTLLTGSEPFEGSNEELLEQHKNDETPDFDLPENVPEAVKDFVFRLTKKWPWNRYDFAADARRDWRALEPAAAPRSGRKEADPSHPGESHPGSLTSAPNTLSSSDFHEVGATAKATPGLLGLRPSPFVGRDEEQQQLLETVAELCDGELGQHCFVLLSGTAGVGKSRLAEWLCQEVHERGLMLPLRARYRKIAAPLDGVVGALVQHYRIEKSRRSTIEKVLMNCWQIDANDDETLTMVAGVATWLCRTKEDNDELGPTGKRFVLDQPEHRWTVIRYALERTAERKPLLIWLDDLHRAQASTFKRLARLQHDLGKSQIMLLATMRNEDVDNDPTARARIELLREDFGGQRIELEPFTLTETKHLLAETLPLRDDVIEVAAKRAKGNPLFALQLLHSWAVRGELELDDGVYVVANEALQREANTTADLWESRLMALSEELRPAALAAAALGGDIRREVLSALLSKLGIDGPRAINGMKRAQLLLLSGSDRLRWPHALLQEHLLAKLSEDDTAPRVFAAASDALELHPAAGSSRIVRHRATNLIRANEIERAATLVHEHVERGWSKVRDATATLRHLQLLDTRLSGHHLARQSRWRAEAARHLGDLDTARRDAEQARRLFRDHGDVNGEAQVLRLMGHIASDLGASAQGRRLVTRAQKLFRQIGSDQGQAQCDVLLGEIDYLLGAHDRARKSLDRAATTFWQIGDALGRAQCLILHGFVEQAGGAHTRARELLGVARADLEGIGYRLGVAQCDLALAHADHREGKFGESHERASATLRAFKLIDNPRGEAGCERLLAMNALDSGHPSTAEVHARSAGVVYARLSDPWGKVESVLLMGQVALYRGDTSAARDALIRCEAVALSEAEPKQHRHLTLAWLAHAEGRPDDAARELDEARRAFSDASQSGDHTPQLLALFERMGWQEPAHSRITSWRASLVERPQS
jgi:tetratricopeptide (TPR) repeat protein